MVEIMNGNLSKNKRSELTVLKTNSVAFCHLLFLFKSVNWYIKLTLKYSELFTIPID